MRLLSLFAFAIALVATPTLADAANGPHCWCEIATACPKDTHQTVHSFGALHQYGRLESGKQRDCATRCAEASSGYREALYDRSGELCERLGPGVYDLHAYSRVGATDTRNNWCDPDDYLGRLTCQTQCECPDGFIWDQAAGQCTGDCDGTFVMTAPTACETTGTWDEGGDPCDTDLVLGPIEVPVVAGTVQVDGESVDLEDIFGDLGVDVVLDHLGLEVEDEPGACGDAPSCE